VADAGNAAADYELAVRFAEGKGVTRDFKLAAKYYEKAADQGLAPAQYRLASLYEKGLGVAQDKLRAKSLYTKAAEAGNPRAMHNLAVLLADGNGKPDYEAAATWFRRAAQYGVHDSQYNLAILLARGLGVQQSLVQSYQWFAVAADQQDVDAAAKRDEVASKLSASDLSVAKALAASFHPRTADLTATEVRAPTGGWDGASTTSPLNSARSKISSL
jgi:localization factor PodJL